MTGVCVCVLYSYLLYLLGTNEQQNLKRAVVVILSIDFSDDLLFAIVNLVMQDWLKFHLATVDGNTAVNSHAF